MNAFGIDLSKLDLWLLSAIGILLVPMISHRLTLFRERQAALRNSISTFRAGFASELSTLRELHIHQIGQVHDILSEAYPKHEAAFLEFEHTLSNSTRHDLRCRWMEYRGPYPIAPELPSEDRRYRLAHLIGSSVNDEETKRDHAIDLLTRLTTHSA